MKILIVGSKHTGSNLFCTPAIRLIRDQLPESSIEVVSLNKLSAEVFDGNEDVDRVHVTSSRRTVSRLSLKADVVLCLNPKSFELCSGAACPIHCVATFSNYRHQADAILEFVAGVLGLKISDSYRRYVIASGELPLALREPADRFIGIHLGCGKTAKHGWKFFHRGRGAHQKLWPVERYVELSHKIDHSFPDHRVVLTGTSNEAFLARQFLKAHPTAISLIGATSATALFTAIERMDVFLSHDCGVLHVAAATTTPLVALFGSTFPDETGPYPPAPKKFVLQRRSMDEITADAVHDWLGRCVSA